MFASCKYIYIFIYICQRPSCTPLALVTLARVEPCPKQATSDGLAVSAHFGEQLHAPHGIDQVRWQAGNLWSTRPGKRCWLAFKDLFLQGDETQKDHFLIVYILHANASLTV